MYDWNIHAHMPWLFFFLLHFFSIHWTARCPAWSHVWWVVLLGCIRPRWPPAGQMFPQPTATPALLCTQLAMPLQGTCTPLWHHAGTLNMSMHNTFLALPILVEKLLQGGPNSQIFINFEYPQRCGECISIRVKKGKTLARPRNTQRPPPSICVSGGLRGVSQSKCLSKGMYCKSLWSDDSAGLA